MTQLFNNVIQPNEFVTFVGFNTQPYAIVYWLKNGERVSRTVCYEANEVDEAIKYRTGYTKDKDYEIEVVGKGTPTPSAA